MEQIKTRLRQGERRHWWLWLTAIGGMLLSAWVILSPPFLGRGDAEGLLVRSISPPAVWILLGLVLLISGYAMHQHMQIKRLRQLLTEETAEKSRLQTEVEDFHRQTKLDPLTGLYNRRSLDEHLAAEVARTQRHGHVLNVLKIDLNHFTQINDLYGQPAGDLVVKVFAERLKKSIRNSDSSVRVGNDEFLVLLPESHAEQIPHILARLSGLEAEFCGKKIPIHFSAGWTGYRPGEEPQQLLERVEQEVVLDKDVGQAEEAIRWAQAEVRQLQNIEALGRLGGRVAHDFNNMLNLVKGYSELVLEYLDRTDPLREYVEQIHQANERASALTCQLLAFSKQEGAVETVNFNAVVADMETRLRRLLGEKIELVVRAGEGLGLVKADREDLEQIILNLAVNARDNLPQGGKLILQTENVELDEVYVRRHPGARPGAHVMLAARDTGTGLDPETRNRIFEPFITVKGKGKRTGLGLAAVYEIVKQSGGYIGVDSEPGQGTTFRIYLPRAEKQVAVA